MTLTGIQIVMARTIVLRGLGGVCPAVVSNKLTGITKTGLIASGCRTTVTGLSIIGAMLIGDRLRSGIEGETR